MSNALAEDAPAPTGEHGVDPTAFPRVAAYLDRLPGGLDAYPDYQAKASLHLGTLGPKMADIDPAGLGPRLGDYLRAPRPVSAWVPETVNAALQLALADACFPDQDSAYFDYIEQRAAEIYSGNLYSLLMRVVSPRMLAKGATRRWSAFRKGIDYRVEIHDNGTRSTLHFPSHLYNELLLRSYGHVVQAAYRVGSAPRAQVKLVSFDDESATYESVWDPDKA